MYRPTLSAPLIWHSTFFLGVAKNDTNTSNNRRHNLPLPATAGAPILHPSPNWNVTSQPVHYQTRTRIRIRIYHIHTHHRALDSNRAHLKLDRIGVDFLLPQVLRVREPSNWAPSLASYPPPFQSHRRWHIRSHYHPTCHPPPPVLVPAPFLSRLPPRSSSHRHINTVGLSIGNITWVLNNTAITETPRRACARGGSRSLPRRDPARLRPRTSPPIRTLSIMGMGMAPTTGCRQGRCLDAR